MIDIVREIEAIQREVGEGTIPAGVGRAVRLRRDFDAPIEDVWDALTNPERIGRWFLPITGDYRLGGRYQFEGNAGGEILACERPDRLKVSWVYGEVSSPADVSELEVRLSTVDGGATRFELDHTAVVPDERWVEYGPGAVGVGWDMGLLGLGLHLSGGSVGDPDGLAGLTRGPRVRDAKQPGVGCSEPGLRRGSRDRRACDPEHDRLLRAGSGRRAVGEPPDESDRSRVPSGDRGGGRSRVRWRMSVRSPNVEEPRAPRPPGRIHIVGAGPVGLFLTALLQSIDGQAVRLYERRSASTRGRGWCRSPPISSRTRSRATRPTRSTGKSVEAIFDPTELETRLAYRRAVAPDLRGLLEAWMRGFVPLNTIERALSELIDDARHRYRRAHRRRRHRRRRRVAMLEPGRHPRRLYGRPFADARPAPPGRRREHA